MKRLTKQVLGCLGLVLVGAITVVAYNLPAPAAAVSGSTVTDTVVVTVLEHGSSTPVYPQDGDVVTDDTIHVITDYEGANEIQYYLSYYDEETGTWTDPVLVHSYCPTTEGGICPPANDDEANGRHDFWLTLPHGHGKYTITTKVLGGDHTVTDEKSITITYTDKDIPVPETGGDDIDVADTGIFTNLNIGRADFLITGLIAFFGVAGFSTYLVLRHRK